MIPFKSHSLIAVPKTLGVRLEIMKAIRKLTEEGLLTKASPEDPEHPGWPAGSPDGRGGKFQPKDSGDNIRTTARSRMSEAECNAQFEGDLAVCRRVRLDACYGQAMARYAACTSGRQIPPLSF